MDRFDLDKFLSDKLNKVSNKAYFILSWRGIVTIPILWLITIHFVTPYVTNYNVFLSVDDVLLVISSITIPIVGFIDFTDNLTEWYSLDFFKKAIGAKQSIDYSLFNDLIYWNKVQRYRISYASIEAKHIKQNILTLSTLATFIGFLSLPFVYMIPTWALAEILVTVWTLMLIVFGTILAETYRPTVIRWYKKHRKV